MSLLVEKNWEKNILGICFIKRVRTRGESSASTKMMFLSHLDMTYFCFYGTFALLLIGYMWQSWHIRPSQREIKEGVIALLSSTAKKFFILYVRARATKEKFQSEELCTCRS